LASLALLFDCIKKVPDEYCRDALKYVFTAMLFSCSEMQLVLKDYPLSSIGWYACRFYRPPIRKEMNVWRAFERRFHSFLNVKRDLNTMIPHVRVTSQREEFLSEEYSTLLFQGDVFKLPRELASRANRVFLDPPYNDDIDYFAFSEFWGSWLDMDFDFKSEWHPRTLKGEGLKRILRRLHDITAPDCTITLAFAPEKTEDWDENARIHDAGYVTDPSRSGPFLYDNSVKRGRKEKGQDFYFTLVKKEHPSAIRLAPAIDFRALREPEAIRSILPYVQVAAHLGSRSDAGVEAIRQRAYGLVPSRLQAQLRTISQAHAVSVQDDPTTNSKAYYTLCGICLRMILSKDGWTLCSLGDRCLPPSTFGASLERWGKGRVPPFARDAVFLAERDGCRLVFYFSNQNHRMLNDAFRKIQQHDKDAYKLLGVLIVPTKKDLHFVRGETQAERFPRVFFASFEGIREAAAMVSSDRYAALCAPREKAVVDASVKERSHSIMSFKAEIVDNKPIGGSDRSHYKLTFRAPPMQGVRPSQFIMMDTTPARGLLGGRTVCREGLRKCVDLTPQPVLKRPFGIHRAFYHHFGRGYLKHLVLPPSLATALHTVYPHEFDILYKVLTDGIGTRLMTKLKKGQEVHMIGPLGRAFDVRSLREKGIREVHVVGGGVGMAPLVFFVQALRYFAFSVKTFIGINKLQSLRYRGDVDHSFQEEPKEAYVYVDDLLEVGLLPEDIFLSCDSEKPASVVRGIPQENTHFGLVTDQYRRFLESRPSLDAGSVMVFACGPDQMMEVVWKICQQARIPLQVLKEKRMACGIGVCLSCVCKVRGTDGGEENARVCTEGPLFDAGEIIWKIDDSKSQSANYCCAPPC
jgi:dihydroorotate dehydrogenase electron transfer subunit